MTKVHPANFSPELLTRMRSALDTAVPRIDHLNRTPATKAKMAQRIVRTASEGITDLHAIDECRGGRGHEIPDRPDVSRCSLDVLRALGIGWLNASAPG